MLPKWLSETKGAACPCCSMSVSRKSSYIAKTINGVRSFIQETFLQEKNACKNGLLQMLDPRLKLVTALALIILLSFTHKVPPLVFVYFLLLVSAYFSKIGARYFLMRTILMAGVFPAIVMVPSIFNVFMPGKPVLVLYKLNRPVEFLFLKLPHELAVTDAGLKFFALFWLRSLTMASTAMIVLFTTKREKILSALGALKVPAFFTFMMSISYRFIYVLVRIVENLHLAKKSRTIRLDEGKVERRWVASRIGWTFEKAINMSNNISQAMVSRGWQGETKAVNLFELRRIDYFAIAVVVPFLMFYILPAAGIL